jgi:hypothetical protein
MAILNVVPSILAMAQGYTTTLDTAAHDYVMFSFVGYSEPYQQTFIKVDFSALPNGAVISSAIWNAKVKAIAGDPPPTPTLEFHRLTQTFTAGATYNKYDGASVWPTGWSRSGGCFTAINAVTGVSVPAINAWFSPNITDMVKYAQANTSKILWLRNTLNPAQNTVQVTCYLEDDATEGNRPYLAITYSLGGTPQIMIF